MDDPLLVRSFERFGYLARNAKRLVHRKGALRDAVREGRTINQLHDERMGPPSFLETVNVRNVRVVERCQRPGFPLETHEAIRIIGDRVGEDFDRDVSSEVRVGGAVDLAHATFANQRGDFVWPDASASRKRHQLVGMSQHNGDARRGRGRCQRFTRSAKTCVYLRHLGRIETRRAQASPAQLGVVEYAATDRTGG